MPVPMPTPIARAAALLLGAALCTAAPVRAQSNAELLQELKALRDRVGSLESRLKAAEAAEAAKPAQAEWGMTPQQVQDFNRIAVKTEGLEDAVEAQGLKMLKISGFMDPTWLYNQRQNRAGFQFLNPVALDGYNYDNSYFGSATIDFQKEMEGGTRWRLTLVPNRGTGSVITEQSIVQEASVSLPLGDLQTRLIAGQIPDWSGYEYQQATLNKLITHNLLYDFTLPTLYTGVGMEYSRGKWLSKWMLANVNASKRNAGEKAPALVYRVDYSKGEFEGFGFAGLHGKLVNYNECGTGTCADSRADLFEADAYFIRGDLTWQGQASVGRQKRAAIVPDPTTGDLRDARWWGLSTLLAYKFIPRWEAIGRLDYVNNAKNGGGLLTYTGYFDSAAGIGGDYRNGIGIDPTLDCLTDKAGAGCSKGTNRVALSLGMSYLYNLNTSFKAELRLDQANLPVFQDIRTGDYRKSNTVFGTSVVVSF